MEAFAVPRAAGSLSRHRRARSPLARRWTDCISHTRRMLLLRRLLVAAAVAPSPTHAMAGTQLPPPHILLDFTDAAVARDFVAVDDSAEGHLPCWNAKVYSNSAAALGRGSVAVALVFATIGFVALQAQLS